MANIIQKYDLYVNRNATFHFTRDLTNFASVYNIPSAVIRMQIRTSNYSTTAPVYEWVSTNTTGGQIRFDSSTNILVIAAPEADMISLTNTNTPLSYDCRLELATGECIILFNGSLTFTPGITGTSNDSNHTGVFCAGDTVFVKNETTAYPIPLPASISAAIASVTGIVTNTTNCMIAANTSALNANTSAASANTSAANANTSAASAYNYMIAANTTLTLATTLTNTFLSIFLGPFPSDTAASSYAASKSITLTSGIEYYNTTENNGRVYNTSTLLWQDIDADTQIQKINATIAAASANTSSILANTSATAANTSALNANTSATAANTSALNANTSAANANTSATSAYNYMIAANTSAASVASANTSALNANTSANSAYNYMLAANNSALNANTSAANAYTYMIAANTSASSVTASITAANTSALNANTSALNANNSAANAYTSALNANNSAANAYTYMIAANTSSTLVATSITAATTAATNANTSAANANTSATSANTSAANANTSALNANISATAANTSAANANTSAGLANTSANSAYNFMLAANTSAISISTAVTLANTSALNANTFALNANTSAGLANTSAANANTYALNANTSATSANTSALNANTSAANANTSALNANTSALNANTSATSANTSAANANTSALNANISATAANTSALNANTSAGLANTSALNANTSALNANTSTNSAYNYMILANTSALNANSSANSAYNYMILGSTSATNANTSALNANTSALNANTSATNANTSATNANTSATNANTSALNANTSAANANTSDASATVSLNAITSLASQVSTNAGLANTSALNANTSATNANTSDASATISLNAITSLASQVSTNAGLAASYSAAAASASATAVVVTGLSNLSSASAAINLSSTIAAVAIDDTSRHTDSGLWRFKVTGSSLYNATLNTATRGSSQIYPAKAVVFANTTLLTITDGTNPSSPMWATFSTVGLTNTVQTINGLIIYAGTGGLYIIDLILDQVFQRTATTFNVCLNYTPATFVQSSAVWGLISSNTLASATINDISTTILPLTPLNPLRYNLPNPTVALATTAGVSVIRSDGVVVNSSSVTWFYSATFDKTNNNLLTSTSAGMGICNQYLNSGWVTNSLANFINSNLGIGSSTKYVRSIGPNLFYIPSSINNTNWQSLLSSTIKLDPINPANSLINKTAIDHNTGWLPGGQGASRLAFAESSLYSGSMVAVTNLLAGVTTSLSGWTNTVPTAGTLTTNGSTVTMTENGVVGPGCSFSYNLTGLVIGQAYTVYTNITGTNIAAGDYVGMTVNGMRACIVQLNQTSFGNIVFVANATSVLVSFGFANNGTNGAAVTVNSMSAVPVASDRSTYYVGYVNGSYNPGNYGVVYGTVTRPIVNSGELVGYSGFSTANYLQVPYSSSLDFGSGDFCVPLWVDLGSTALASQVTFIDRSNLAGTGAYFRVQTNASGYMQFIVYDGTNIATVTDSIAPPINTSTFYTLVRRSASSAIELWRNGVKVASTAIGSVGALSNATAVINIGLSVAGTNPFNTTNGIIALPRISAIAPTPDQIAFMYASELPLFASGAKCLQHGAGNINNIAYDPDQNLVAVSQQAGTDIFQGLQCVKTQLSSLSTNLLSSASLPATWSFTRASFGPTPSSISVLNWPGAIGWAFTEDSTATNTHTLASSSNATVNATTYSFGIPLQSAGRGYVKLSFTGAVVASAWVTLATGVITNTTNCTGLAPVAINGGFQIGVTFTTTSASSFNFVVGAATGTVTGNDTYSGTGIVSFYFGKPQINLGSTLTTYTDGLSNNNNHKQVAFFGQDLIIGTPSGVDAFLQATDGLRTTAKKRPAYQVYNPTTGVLSVASTSATPITAYLTPIKEGYSVQFKIKVGCASYGGAFSQYADFEVRGRYYRPIGGNATVQAETPTVIQRSTSTMAIAVSADTTNQAGYVTLTGLASTTLGWTIEAVEWIDSGLQSAA